MLISFKRTTNFLNYYLNRHSESYKKSSENFMLRIKKLLRLLFFSIFDFNIYMLSTLYPDNIVKRVLTLQATKKY